MNNLESTLISINQYINIDSDRQAYTAHFDYLRDTMFKKLREDMPFKYLFNGFQLGGSYGDNLKVNMPDEFDQVFFLNLPEARNVKIIDDPQIPGNIFLDISRILAIIEKQPQHAVTYKFLKQWVDYKNRLIVAALQNWLKNCFTKVMGFLRNKIEHNGHVSNLQYRCLGPAHTIFVTGRYSYSVDFVPAILLYEAPGGQGQWEAIPKPLRPPQPHSTSFRSSFYRQESAIIANNYTLKNALRMMKRFRDTHQNMSNLKSYYIKTLFMWKAKAVPNSYWRSSLKTILIDMFGELEDALYRQQLKFYWNPRLNMFDQLGSVQLHEMLKCVQGARRVLMNSSINFDNYTKYRVVCLFTSGTDRRSQGILNPNAPIVDSEPVAVDDDTTSSRCVIN